MSTSIQEIKTIQGYEVRVTAVTGPGGRRFVQVDIEKPTTVKADPKKVIVQLPVSWVDAATTRWTNQINAANDQGERSATIRELDRPSHDWKVIPPTAAGQYVTLSLLCLPRTREKPQWVLRVYFLLVDPLPQGPLTVELQIPPGAKEEFIPFTVSFATKPERLPAFLYTEGQATNLEFEKKVTLRWQLKDIQPGTATLYGLLPGEKPGTPRTSRKLDDQELETGQQTVTATELHQLYTLEATAKGEKEPRRDYLYIGVKPYAAGGTVEVFPRFVFSNGPVAVYCSYFGAPVLIPEVSSTQAKYSQTINPLYYLINQRQNRQQVEEDRALSFKMKWGPGQGETWQVRGTLHKYKDQKASINQTIPVDDTKLRRKVKRRLRADVTGLMPAALSEHFAGEKNAPLHKLAASALDAHAELAKAPDTNSELSQADINGFAAGEFQITDPAGATEYHWLVITTRNRIQLYLRQSGHWAMILKQLPSDLTLLGAGTVVDPKLPECQWPVLVYKSSSEKHAKLQELRFRQNETPAVQQSLTLDDGVYPVVDEDVRIIGAGRHVYILAAESAMSYQRPGGNERPMIATEPALRRFSAAEWEVVGVTHPELSLQPIRLDGYLFALNKKNGQLVRFDCASPLGKPLALDPADGSVAPIDYLQRAQQGEADYLVSKWYKRQDAESPTRRSKRKPAKIKNAAQEKEVRAITEDSTLLNVQGALLGRSLVPDPDTGGRQRLILDRAYDPRLDVWVKCGHPFAMLRRRGSDDWGAIDEDRQRDKPRFCSSPTMLWCREKSGGVWFIASSNLLEPLGFRTTDVKPLPATSLAAARFPESDRLYSGEGLLVGQSLSSPSGLRFGILDGKLRLRKKDGTELWGRPPVFGKGARLELTAGGNLEGWNGKDLLWNAADDPDTQRTHLWASNHGRPLPRDGGRLVVTDGAKDGENVFIYGAQPGSVLWHALPRANVDAQCECDRCWRRQLDKATFGSADWAYSGYPFDDIDKLRPLPGRVVAITYGANPGSLAAIRVEYESLDGKSRTYMQHGRLWRRTKEERFELGNASITRVSGYYNPPTQSVEYLELLLSDNRKLVLGIPAKNHTLSTVYSPEWFSYDGDFRVFFGCVGNNSLQQVGMYSTKPVRKVYGHYEFTPKHNNHGNPWDDWQEGWRSEIPWMRSIKIRHGARINYIETEIRYPSGFTKKHGHDAAGLDTTTIQLPEEEDIFVEFAGYMPNHPWAKRRGESHWLRGRRRGNPNWIHLGGAGEVGRGYGSENIGLAPTFHVKGEFTALKGRAGDEIDLLGFHSRSPILAKEWDR